MQPRVLVFLLGSSASLCPMRPLTALSPVYTTYCPHRFTARSLPEGRQILTKVLPGLASLCSLGPGCQDEKGRNMAKLMDPPNPLMDSCLDPKLSATSVVTHINSRPRT